MYYGEAVLEDITRSILDFSGNAPNMSHIDLAVEDLQDQFPNISEADLTDVYLKALDDLNAQSGWSVAAWVNATALLEPGFSPADVFLSGLEAQNYFNSNVLNAVRHDPSAPDDTDTNGNGLISSFWTFFSTIFSGSSSKNTNEIKKRVHQGKARTLLPRILFIHRVHQIKTRVRRRLGRAFRPRSTRTPSDSSPVFDLSSSAIVILFPRSRTARPS